MAKVKITGHASGSGVFTITAPNSNTDRTITLPDASVTLGTDATKLPLAGGTMTGDLILNDNVKLEIGSLSGGDLQIYHDSSAGASYIKDVGTGHLQIAGTNVNILNAADSEYSAKFITDGAVELYHNNVKKLETTATGVTVTGEVSASSGSFLKQQDPTVLAYKDLDVSNAHTNIGNFTIDERGRYRIGWDLRMGWAAQSGFVWTYLGTSSAGGKIGNARMVIENMATQSGNANIGLHFQQVMDFGTSLSYPYTVYVNAYTSGNGSTTLFNQSDTNGYPVVSCLKVADIATSTGMVVFGS